MNVAGRKSRTVGLDQKSAYAIRFIVRFIRPSIFRTDLGPDHRHVSDRAGGDPHLFAVQDILFAHFLRTCPHAARIRSEVRFSQSEAAELFALLHRGEPGVFLLVRAEGINWIHYQRRLHADKRAHAGISAFQFLRDQSVFHVRHAGAAIAVQRGAEESEIGHRLNEFAREAPGAVALLNDRYEIVFNEAARRIAHQAFVVIQQRVEADEIHTTEFDGWHYVSPHKVSRQRTGN